MNSIITLLMLAVQTHTPTATVSGDVVTVSADIAWIDYAPVSGQTVPVVVPVAIKEGTILVDKTMLASYDGVKPVAWQLPPGTYKVTAFGYPDSRLNPMRTKVVLDVVIANPTRQQQLKDALKKFSIASAEAAMAKAEIVALNPTKAELTAALAP